MLFRPTLLSTSSFDATLKKVFMFNVQSGSSQIVANKLTIKNQVGNEIVYEQKQSSFKYEHILPANVLKNGEYYNATITVFDVKDNESAPSSPIQFRCYTTPVIEFTNISESASINNSSYTFMFSYNQAEGERLNSYIINLYNYSQVIISSSSQVYVQDGTPPYTGSYLFTGLLDGTTYFIECVCETINGAVVRTKRIPFNVNYEQPDLFTLLVLKNNCQEGHIELSSNIILIDGDTEPSPPIFIDGKEIDVTGPESFVEWKQGYSISGDFVARGWFRKPNKYATILQFSNTSGQTIKVDFMEGYDGIKSSIPQVYLQVTVESVTKMPYFIISNYINPVSDMEYYSLQLKRENNVYQVKILGGVV